MSENLQKLPQAAVEPRREAEWPRWLADALAYKPESSAPVVESPPRSVDTDDRRDIRVLRRVPNP